MNMLTDLSNWLLRNIRILLIFGLCSCTLARRFRMTRGSNSEIRSVLRGDIQYEPMAQWFTQQVDHFSPSDTRTWRQRYYVNDAYFDTNNPGPVFLIVGGEERADPYWLVNTRSWIVYAKQFNALCITLEHRYYGESHPTTDASDNNLKYLSSQQALADLANFIAGMNNKYKLNDNVKWVAFGGSYAGSLAAWLRLKYPRSVHAAVSSSAPILAKLDFKEYYETVVNAFAVSGSKQCVEVIKAAHRQIAEMIDKKQVELESKFKLCKSLNEATKSDISYFYTRIADMFGAVALGEESKLTIQSVCSILTQRTGIPEYERLATFSSVMLDAEKGTCFDYDYNDMISALRNPSWSSYDVGINDDRQWLYQTCSEFGYFLTSSGEPEAFGDSFRVDFFLKQCQDIFGAEFTQAFIQKRIDQTNKMYGALDISVDRVVFVHGSNDPWHTLGVTKTRQEGVPAIYIHGTSHCGDIYLSKPDDPEALKGARANIVQYLSKWLNTK